MPSPTTLVFDIGNVLIGWDPRNLYRRLFADSERMEWFLTEVCNPEWNLEQDRGRLFAEAVTERIAAFPQFEAEIRAYDERWPDMISGPIPGSVRLLEAVRGEGRPNYAITNFSHEKFALAQEMFGFLRGFDGIVVSGDEKVVKPDPAIYRILIERHGLDPSDCIFIDDSPANVAGAGLVGMRGVHFASPNVLLRDLDAAGYALPALP